MVEKRKQEVLEARDATATRVYLVTDGALNLIPFDVLVDTQDRNLLLQNSMSMAMIAFC